MGLSCMTLALVDVWLGLCESVQPCWRDAIRDELTAELNQYGRKKVVGTGTTFNYQGSRGSHFTPVIPRCTILWGFRVPHNCI